MSQESNSVAVSNGTDGVPEAIAFSSFAATLLYELAGDLELMGYSSGLDIIRARAGKYMNQARKQAA